MSRRNRNRSGDGVYDAWMNNANRNRWSAEERMYLDEFTQMSCARFKWVGLPEEIDVRFLELTLFTQGLAVFFRHDEFDKYMTLRASQAGEWNAYDTPTSFTVYGNREVMHKDLAYGRAKKQCVPIWANYLRRPDFNLAMLYASRLARLDRTIENTLTAYRKPFIVAVDESERLTFQQVMRQHDEGQAVIFGSRGLADIKEKIQVLDMRIDKDLALNLLVAQGKIWNQCMTFLGINNANQEKRERLVASEVSANDSQVEMARNAALDARKQACAEINDLYKLNVSVEWNTEDTDDMHSTDNDSGNTDTSGDENA